MAALLQQFARRRNPARLIWAGANDKLRDCCGNIRSVHVHRYVQIRHVSIPARPRLDTNQARRGYGIASAHAI
jgi:hypothetical protein